MKHQDRLEPQPVGKDVATVHKAQLLDLPTEKVDAVLFIPEGASPGDDMEIRVVQMDPAGMAAIVARRC